MEQRFDSLKAGQKFTKTFWNGWAHTTGTFVLVRDPETYGRRTVTLVRNESGKVHQLNGQASAKVEVIN